MLRYETYTCRHCSVRLSLIPGRKNVVLFEVYYCALRFDNLAGLVRHVTMVAKFLDHNNREFLQ